MAGLASPNGGQRFALAEAPLVGLAGAIIMRVHHHRFRAINHTITFGAAPARVFVILGILQLVQKAAPGPNVLTQAAADHAEKMLPLVGLAVFAEAPLIVMGIDSPAVRTRNLAAKH